MCGKFSGTKDEGIDYTCVGKSYMYTHQNIHQTVERIDVS